MWVPSREKLRLVMPWECALSNFRSSCPVLILNTCSSPTSLSVPQQETWVKSILNVEGAIGKPDYTKRDKGRRYDLNHEDGALTAWPAENVGL